MPHRSFEELESVGELLDACVRRDDVIDGWVEANHIAVAVRVDDGRVHFQRRGSDPEEVARTDGDWSVDREDGDLDLLTGSHVAQRDAVGCVESLDDASAQAGVRPTQSRRGRA